MTGLMARVHQACRAAQAWVERLEADANVWDQNAFNDLRHLGGTEPALDLPAPQDRLWK